MLALLAITACLPAPSTTAEPEPYVWQGWVYGDLPAEDSPALDVGTVRAWSMDGTLIAEGSQQDSERPAVWTLELEEAADIELRISGPNHVTTVWRTQTPATQSYWYAGSLFAADTATMDAFWADLSEITGESLATSDGANLLGEPLWVWAQDEAAWTDATVTVYDGERTVHRAITLTQDADGMLVPTELLNGPIAAFAATDLAPGPIRLVIDSSDGRSSVIDYNAGPGELLSAFSFTLPEPQ